jgi:protein-disulfide isomerase
MTARPLSLTVFAAVLAAAACSSARTAPPPAESDTDAQAVVARVEGRPITRKEVDAKASGALQRLEDEEYQARRDALDELITDRLVDAEAGKQGLSREELMKREVAAKIASPTPGEIAAVYDRNKDRVGGRSLAQLTPEIQHSILEQRSAERAQQYLEELRRNAKVAVTLAQPRNAVPIPADAKVLGPAKAPVTIVEYSDYLCPYCQRAQSVVDEVLAHNEGKVRFVHRDFLLGRPRSMAVARAALCAADQGKFWDYRRNLLETHGDYTDEDLLGRTKALGLEPKAFQACLASDRHDKAILDASDDGTHLGVHATPTFFINGRRMTGVRSVDQFQELIDSELKAGG